MPVHDSQAFSVSSWKAVGFCFWYCRWLKAENLRNVLKPASPSRHYIYRYAHFSVHPCTEKCALVHREGAIGGNPVTCYYKPSQKYINCNPRQGRHPRSKSVVFDKRVFRCMPSILAAFVLFPFTLSRTSEIYFFSNILTASLSGISLIFLLPRL